jgi:adenylate kinase family enzyme
VCECQNVIFYDVPEETLIARCAKRAETSGRADDNLETLIKRFKAFNEQSKPVVELYQKFGKVHYIAATGTVAEVYQETKKAMLPQTFFIIGPKCSGKTTLGKALSERTNMKLINFSKFIKDNDLKSADDETKTMGLIKLLVNETVPRVLIEDFPQNEYQAKFFIKNCLKPQDVFYVSCGKDTCQERMLALGKEHPSYLPSSILSKKIKNFHDSATTLIPYLKANTAFHEISSEETFQNSFKSLYKTIEPVVIHVRAGASSNDLRREIIEKLVDQYSFTNLDVNSLIRDENERKTAIGQEFHSLVSAGKLISADMIVRMLRNIIYSGDGRTQFILSGFPDVIDQAKEFEKSCCSIAAIIYATSKDPVVEIKNNNLTLFNIDALFQKEFRLRTMNEWDFSQISDIKSNLKVNYSIVIGKPMSGKTHICKLLEKHLGFKIIDMKVIEEQIKKSKGTEEEPFEGQISSTEIYAAIDSMM